MDEPSSDIGRRLRRIRQARRKNLNVIAGLAGISPSYLSRLEHGERALDRRSLIVALANALQVAPSDLTALPMPAPGNGGMDTAVEDVRWALLAASSGTPPGQVQPVQVLRERVSVVLDAMYRAEDDRDIGAALPGLIRDLHATLAAGRGVAELLGLAVLLHTRAVIVWLSVAGAPLDLRSQSIMFAQRCAGELGNTVPMGLVTAARARVMRAGGLSISRGPNWTR